MGTPTPPPRFASVNLTAAPFGAAVLLRGCPIFVAARKTRIALNTAKPNGLVNRDFRRAKLLLSPLLFLGRVVRPATSPSSRTRGKLAGGGSTRCGRSRRLTEAVVSKVMSWGAVTLREIAGRMTDDAGGRVRPMRTVRHRRAYCATAGWCFACQRASASCGFETAGSIISCCTPVEAVSSTI